MQLQRNLNQFEAVDVAVFAISYDPVADQRAFAEEFGITFPLLADPDHAVIEATGILNTLIAPDEEYYGLPFPGSYVVGVDGTIEEKLFFQHYRTRPSAATVLRDGLGIDFEVRENPHDEMRGDHVTVRATLGGEGVVFGEVAVLYVDLDLADGVHVYAPPVPAGYVATVVSVGAPDGVEVGPARYPPSTPFRVDGIDEEFQVFAGSDGSDDGVEGPVRIAVPVRNGLRDGDSFQLSVNVRYQACTDSECFLPQNMAMELRVPQLDLVRRSDPG